MQIAAFIKQSLIDWDGKVSSVIFTKACNLRCFYCHNPNLVLPELVKKVPSIDQNEVFDFLESHKTFLDGVVITGGEPTLQADLKDFVKKLKAMGYKVKLDTNGTNPTIVKELIKERLLDFIAMDIKAIPNLESYKKITLNITNQLIENIIETSKIIMKSRIPHLFRKTYMPDENKSDWNIIERDFNPIVFQEYKHSTKILSDFL